MVVRPKAWRGNSERQDRFLGDLVRKDAPWRHTAFEDGVELLAWPMSRFYNDGDAAAAQIDWSYARVLEKLDGTMTALYWDPLKLTWCVATRSVPEADLPVRPGHIEIGDSTFSDMFWCALDATIRSNLNGTAAESNDTNVVAEFLLRLNKNVTYVFELTGPYNKVVVSYADQRVTLLAARNIRTGLEIDVNGGLFKGRVPAAKEWSIKGIDALRWHVSTLRGIECEGAVVLDASAHPFRRVKVKSREWLLASMFKDTIDTSRRGALRFIIEGTWDDAQTIASPEVKRQFEAMARGLRAYCARVDSNFERWRGEVAGSATPRKDFALKVQAAPKSEQAPTYFQLWEQKTTSTSAWLTSAASQGRLSDSLLDDILAKVDMCASTDVSQVFRVAFGPLTR
jgi:hypothetical protein